jgi:hypothetical protein
MSPSPAPVILSAAKDLLWSIADSWASDKLPA